MKKLLVIIVMGLLWSNITLSNEIGEGEKKVDINLVCTQFIKFDDKKIQAQIDDGIKTGKIKLRKVRYGIKIFKDKDLILTHNKKRNEYTMPFSTVLRGADNKDIREYFYYKLMHPNEIWEYVLILDKNKNDYTLYENIFNVDSQKMKIFKDMEDKVDRERNNIKFVDLLQNLTSKIDGLIIKIPRDKIRNTWTFKCNEI